MLFKDTQTIIFLYGSRARGDYRRGADFDIGVESIGFQVFRRLKIPNSLTLEKIKVGNSVLRNHFLVPSDLS